MEKSDPDLLTELEHGEGAVRVAGKFVVRGSSGCGDGQIMFAGSCYRLDGQNELIQCTGELERWDCEVIIIPRRKLGPGYSGYRIDQILCSDFGNNKNWSKELWKAKDFNLVTQA